MDFYLPEDALQGQEVPAHVLWSDLNWESIEVRFTNELSLRSAFNTKKDATTEASGVLSVHGLERDGFLGLVFKSHRVDSLSTNAKVDLQVLLKGGARISESRVVRLFRPNLKLREAPQEIIVNEKGAPSSKIELEHEGYGTLMVAVESDKQSDIETTMPESIKKAVEGFALDFAKSIESLEAKYPQHADFFKLSNTLDFSKRDEALAKLADAAGDFSLSKDFLEDITDAFSAAVLRNTDFESLFIRPIVDFVRSATVPGIILTTPFYEIECSEKAAMLQLKVSCVDVLGYETQTFILPPVRIRARRKERIQVGSLLGWITSRK